MIKCPECDSEIADIYDTDGVGWDEKCYAFAICENDHEFKITYQVIPD